MKESDNTILLAGGNSSLSGLQARLESDIRTNVNGLKTCIKRTSSRDNAAWIGGSLFTQQSNFIDLCITEDLYFEHGAQLVHRLCFWSCFSYLYTGAICSKSLTDHALLRFFLFRDVARAETAPSTTALAPLSDQNFIQTLKILHHEPPKFYSEFLAGASDLGKLATPLFLFLFQLRNSSSIVLVFCELWPVSAWVKNGSGICSLIQVSVMYNYTVLEYVLDQDVIKGLIFANQIASLSRVLANYHQKNSFAVINRQKLTLYFCNNLQLKNFLRWHHDYVTTASLPSSSFSSTDVSLVLILISENFNALGFEGCVLGSITARNYDIPCFQKHLEFRLKVIF